MRRLLLACTALLLTTAAAAPAQGQRGGYDRTLRQDCIGNRCAVYAPGGRRLGSLTEDGTGRTEVRDSRNRLRAKLTPVDGGVRVQRWPRGR